MRKVIKTVGLIILAVIILLGIIGAIFFSGMAASMGVGNAEVADYDRRVEIWEHPAGYSTERKIDHMNAKANGNVFLQQILFASAIVGEDYKDAERTIDSFTYLYEVKGGYEKETYEDIPYVIPYLSEGSDSAVIVLPGGGFSFKSMYGSNGEGKDVAATLQENCINAFVLHYRSNPYEYPIPQLDLQRAIRYLRFHAEEYGINPDKIGVIGFSAGGFEIGCFINQIKGHDCFPDGYDPDEIDSVDDSIVSAAMIYPALSFNHNVPMLFAMFDDEDVRDPEKREELLSLMDMKNCVANSKDVPQFIAWGTKDSMVGSTETPAYIEAARKIGINITEIVADGQDHGFGQNYYMADYLEWFEKIVRSK